MGNFCATRFDDFFFVKLPLKQNLQGRLLAARINILPFFFLKWRRSLTQRKIHARFRQLNIARHAQKKNQIAAVTHMGEIKHDTRIRLQLAEVTYMLRLRASDSRKIESTEESL